MSALLTRLMPLALIVTLGAFGCSKSTATDAESGARANTAADGVIALRIEGNDQMKFNVDRLEAKAGAKVELTLVHTGKMPAATMGHNWVLLAAGTDDQAFMLEAMKAKDTAYIPAGMKDKVIAHTPVIGGGEEAKITFTAPAAGEYTFICSFPGHAALMRGTLVVE